MENSLNGWGAYRGAKRKAESAKRGAESPKGLRFALSGSA